MGLNCRSSVGLTPLVFSLLGSGIQLPTTATAVAAAAQAAALQLNGAVPLGALNPAALTGRLGFGKGREWLGPGKKECSVLTNFASLCSSSESSPEPRLSGTCLPVLPAFQPLYPSDHVNLGTYLSLVSSYFPSFGFYLPLLLAPGKSVAQYTISLCLWVLPLPSPHLPFYGPFTPFCGPSHPEGVDIDFGGIGATLRHQEELLPMAPLGMDSAE